jgi:5-methylcytosine-specific restriction endonuclease McrA
MFAYCVGELHLSEDAAFKRIQAARIARQFPVIFEAVADGRLNLTAVVLLRPCLTRETVDELLAAATHRSKSEIERLLAERFPQPDLPACLQVIPSTSLALSVEQVALGQVERAAGVMEVQLVPEPVETFVDRPRVKPLSPHRFALQVTIEQSTHDKLRHAQALLGRECATGDVARVLDRALDALIAQLEKRRFAATAKPRRAQRRVTQDRRHVPAHVKATVWERDGGQCTFVSNTGRRCPARDRLEFDHVNEFARGGSSNVANIRLLCRAHNQYQAERTFGAGFMGDKRRAAAEKRTAEKARAAEARAAAKAQAAKERARLEAVREKAREVIPYLRRLEFSAEEARRGAVLCESHTDAPLEERVRIAVSRLRPRVAPCTGATPAGAPARAIGEMTFATSPASPRRASA